jgi:hypothetical protein
MKLMAVWIYGRTINVSGQPDMPTALLLEIIQAPLYSSGNMTK